MAYKTILLHLDSSDRCRARVEQGCAVAVAYDAHLVGLAVVPPLNIPGTSPAEMVVDMLSEQWELDRGARAAVAEEFVAKARASGVSKVESRFVVGFPENEVALHGRYADLIVVGQASPKEGGIAQSLVLNAGRPVLIVPRDYEPRRVGEHVLVAWNASREATRALTDALPILSRASQVDVLTVNAEPRREGHGELPGADIALYLTRHGVRANVLQTSGDDIDVGEWLLSRAADLASDLVVMGAYGHSRLRELVLGGATRTVLESMTVPVLMSH
ncbi:MAG: universal stress protein [Betaproteobacteria bacterium]|nr:MAG: universal stress protein [Betaproteobacteria bacterium]